MKPTLRDVLLLLGLQVGTAAAKAPPPASPPRSD
jgi:hypothetical protein